MRDAELAEAVWAPSGKSRARIKTIGIHFFIETSFSGVVVDKYRDSARG
jgi:hypothetical protein